MAPRTYRRRRTYRRPLRRSAYRRWWRRPGSYRFTKRVVNRSSRSTTTVALRDTNNVTFSLAPAANFTDMHIISPFVVNNTPAATMDPTIYNHWLAGDYLFRTYCNLYDQMKIEKIGYKFTAIDTIGNGGQLGAVRMICAWDRYANYLELFQGQRPLVQNLMSMAGTRSAMFANNSRVKMYVTLHPSDLQERSLWFDVDPIGIGVTAAQSGLANDQNFRALPPFGSSGSSGPFFPTLYVALYSPIANGTAANIPINIMMDTYCTVSFRNPKYSYQATNRSIPKTVTIDIGKQPEEGDIEMEPIHREDTLIDLK